MIAREHATAAARQAAEAKAHAEQASANLSAALTGWGKRQEGKLTWRPGYNPSATPAPAPAPPRRPVAPRWVAPTPQGAVPVQAPTPPGGAVDEAVQEKARMIDKKLWEGAAAAGWQLHQYRSNYIYTAPNGTRYTTQKEAKLHLKQAAPPLPPRVQWMAGAKGSFLPASGGRGRGHGGRGRGAGVQKQSRGRSPVALEPRSHAPEAQPRCPQPLTPLTPSLHQLGEQGSTIGGIFCLSSRESNC